MRKNLCFILTIFLLAACGKIVQRRQDNGFIEQMLRRQSQYIVQSPEKNWYKSLQYNGRQFMVKVNRHEILKMDSSLMDMDLDKLIHNTGFNKSISENNGITELKLKPKPEEKSPFKLVECYYTKTDDSLQWHSMLVQQEQNNVLYHSEESYILNFHDNVLTSITLHTIEKGLLGKKQDFRVNYIIR